MNEVKGEGEYRTRSASDGKGCLGGINTDKMMSLENNAAYV
jgi:hypothetical protein